MDNLKAMQKKHETKMKKQMKPLKSMMGVHKGYDMEEKGEKKRDKESKE